MMGRVGTVGLALILLCSLGGAAPGAVPATSGADAPSVLILDTTSLWRMHHTFKAPVIDVDGALKSVVPTGSAGKMGAFWQSLMEPETAPPSPDWLKPDFDDGTWVHGPARRACRTPYLSRLCLRGAFTATDPQTARGLTLTVDYHGGAVVYLNGKEIARGHLPAGAAMAEAYPPEAFLAEDGKLLSLRGDETLWKPTPSTEVARRIESRVRRLSVPIPAQALRQGINVVMIELVRAPYHKAVDEQKALLKAHGEWQVHDLSWNTCEIRRVQLSAAEAAGVVSGAARPEGLHVWNSDPLAVDHDLDLGNPAEPLRPIALVGARNGTFSGKVVVASPEPIRGLTATAGDLKGDGGTILASQLRLRYGRPWGDLTLTNQSNNETIPYPAEVSPLLALYETAPKEVSVARKEISPRCQNLPGQPEPAFGAVVSVWLTVKVPADARPGAYAGQVTIAAEGRRPLAVPVSLKVVDWTLPHPHEYRTWVELIQSPDTLAMEYGVEPWSERHFELIGRSMRFLREAGSSVLYVPLIAQSNAGNEQSMVRWISKGEDRYEYDFSVMEKYLDTAEKHMGKPEVVVLNVWDRYLIREGSGGRDFQVSGGLKIAAKGPLVTVVDPATKKTENVFLPDYTDPSSKPLWGPLFEQLRERMRKRGIEKAMMLGMATDFWATKEQVEFLKDASGGLPWVNAGHYSRESLYSGLARFGYQTSYFGAQFGFGKSLCGWKGKELDTLFERVGLDSYPITKWRQVAEQSISGNRRGIGRLGADAWLAVKDKSGARRARAWERYPGGNWGYLNANSSVLAPSPEGAVATQRFEALREGVQECEARIVIEGALTDAALRKQLGEDLAQRCEAALNERRLCLWRGLIQWQSGPSYRHDVNGWREGGGWVTGHTWFLGSGWQDRSEKLYCLAGDVARISRPK